MPLWPRITQTWPHTQSSSGGRGSSRSCGAFKDGSTPSQLFPYPLVTQLSVRTLLTLCPSPSTLHQLEEQSFRGVRLWPRGVDVSQYSPNKRSSGLREIWGVHTAVPSREPEVLTGAIKQHLPISASVHEIAKLGKTENFIGYNFQGRKASLPLTPPESPAIMPVGSASVTAGIPRTASPSTADERCVLLYIGRMSV